MVAFCELLNMAMILLNMFICDMMLVNKFWRYGSEVMQYVMHMNKNAVVSVSSFLEQKKGCEVDEGKERGHLVRSELGESKCCSTPWADTAHTVCYDQFAR